MQRSAVVVVADKTSLKRPFIFACAVNMALCFFMLTMTVAGHRDLLQAGQLVSNVSVVILYILEIGCLLLSVLGVIGACRGKRWRNTGVVREESKLLAMMPLTGTNKANRTLLYSIQAHIRLRGSATLGAPKNQYVYQEVVLLVMSIKLMIQIERKQEFMALLQSNRYVPGAF
eukprot:superscaffoldBa00002098_g13170